MNLLEINEEAKRLNKNIENGKDEIRKQEYFKNDLITLITAIINGDEEVSIRSKTTYEMLKLKSVKKKRCSDIEAYFMNEPIEIARYDVKLTKTNIEKIQNYINDVGFHY